MRFIFIFLLVIGCTKDYDLNPYTTVIKQLIKHENNDIIPYNHSKQE